MKPPVVLRPNEVEGPSIEPRHHQPTVVQGIVDVLDGQPPCTAANGEPATPIILGLHRENAPDDVLGRVAAGAGELLRGEALEAHGRSRNRRVTHDLSAAR